MPIDTVERYERGERAGYAFSVRRGKKEINVPAGAERFLYASKFLRHLSRTQAWVEEPDQPAREKAEGDRA